MCACVYVCMFVCVYVCMSRVAVELGRDSGMRRRLELDAAGEEHGVDA